MSTSPDPAQGTIALPYSDDVPAGSPGEPHPAVPDFATVRSGFHPGQVHQWASGLLHRLDKAERAVAELAGQVVHDTEHAAQTPQGQQMLADLMQLALDEITGQQAAAAEAARKVLADATAQKGQVLAAAEEEAARLVGGAREQVDTLLNESRAGAKQMLDSASARAAAVAEGADRRLQALTAQHEETIRRISEIHQVTGSLLGHEDGRGSLADEVGRVLPAAVTASAPAQITASRL